eukprot:jgi/Bigna1/90729/estExt_fgenesh1_pg.C_780008
MRRPELSRIILLALAALYVEGGGTFLSLMSNVTMAGDGIITCPDECRMRLTTDNPSMKGGAWSKKLFNIAEGFTTTFTIQFLDHGHACATAQGFTEYCLTRGAHGVAFVIYGEDTTYGAVTDLSVLLGQGGAGLGYEGLKNSIAIEFDMFYDRSKGDLHDNHVGIMTRGREGPISAEHKYSLGSTANVPEFSFERAHDVKIVYQPDLDQQDLLHHQKCVKGRSCDNFQNQPYFAHLLSTGHFPAGKIGTMHVFIDDFRFARVIVPMRVETILNLAHWEQVRLGFTGTTSVQNWQKQDIYNWTICTGTGHTTCSPF